MTQGNGSLNVMSQKLGPPHANIAEEVGQQETTDRTTLWAALASGALLLTCCGLPLLAGVIGAAGMAALLSWGSRAFLPVIGLLIVAGAFVLFRRVRQKRFPAACAYQAALRQEPYVGNAGVTHDCCAAAGSKPTRSNR